MEQRGVGAVDLESVSPWVCVARGDSKMESVERMQHGHTGTFFLYERQFALIMTYPRYINNWKNNDISLVLKQFLAPDGIQ